eukprot:7303912-Heterocapsa_arctica.AAC.1
MDWGHITSMPHRYRVQAERTRRLAALGLPTSHALPNRDAPPTSGQVAHSRDDAGASSQQSLPPAPLPASGPQDINRSGMGQGGPAPM